MAARAGPPSSGKRPRHLAGPPGPQEQRKAKIFLPELAEGGPAETECFARYRAYLEEHEALHVRAARQAADELVDIFRRVNSVDEFRAAAHQLQAALDASDRGLDERTNHGGRECRWPPVDCRHRTPGRQRRKSRRR
ncbi:MAG: DUF922 domain-containing protein [Actinomycetota bacterium]